MSMQTRRSFLGLVASASALGLAGCGSRTAPDDARYPKEVTVSGGDDTLAAWVLPGKRRLDEAIFGTPAQPKGLEEDIGVPLDARETNADGTEFTQTAMPTPFSDEIREITGSFEYTVTDTVPYDTPDSDDTG
ncbi:hypothetical protein GRX03_14975 [Halovenus sp. WSH3]|uniref:Uncharacterized protein n=1 Tax=Halovenus carboxidivorans TaxID=2692199 RepID=A0A6B0TCE1_9EURY|nr:hypothetical protein [Halovenus carboxidivorans]MXR52901.1 hypothetical protein [Halovenus carboxidivorans]